MRSLHLMVFACLVCSCGPEERGRVTLPLQDECDDFPDRVLCNGSTALRCGDRDVVQRVDCAQTGLTCAPGVGCRACVPDAISCDGSARYQCSSDGSERTLLQTCAEGLQCSKDGCSDL